MQRFIARRVLQSLGVLVVLALVVFALARVTGNPADLFSESGAHWSEKGASLLAQHIFDKSFK